MKAMIFAAGLGTRLRPYTNDRPKALAEVGGLPLLEIQLRRLQRFGFTEVTVNLHHYADMVEAFLRTWDGRGMILHRSDERDLLLDTGGGLLHARPFLDTPGPVYVVNVDVLSDLDPRSLMAAHAAQASPTVATLAVTDRATSRRLTFDGAMQLTGWENTETGAQKGHPQPGDQSLAFAGMQVISPALFPLIGRSGAFSIIDLYLDLVAPPAGEHAPQAALVRGHVPDMRRWMDVGKPAELERAAEYLPELLR